MILNVPDIVVIILVLIAVIIDVRSRRIPNYLTLSGWGIGLMYHVVTGGLDGLIFSSAGLVLGICLLLLFYLLGGVGAADVKLMGAIGAFLGWEGVFHAFLFSAVIGGLYSVAVMAEAGVLGKILKNIWETVKGFFLTKSISYKSVNRNLKICYGLPIALGTILSLWLGDRVFQF
ncbi:MAG: A24 family peptidase [Thermodesulfobacteriota bacterium]|nr:A24 family peptidase [Thermodesulfobacteriota bacterium]